MDYCIVITTCAEKKEADHLASHLTEGKLAACVQINKITSYYTWKGKVHNETEYRLIIKTKVKFYKKIEQCIKDIHRYEVPEIIRIPVQTGLKEYLDWIDEVTG